VNELDNIFSEDALKAAWWKVKAKGSAGGADNLLIVQFEENLDRQIGDLKNELTGNSYVPEPYSLINKILFQ
jgi:hypothetical protein